MEDARLIGEGVAGKAALAKCDFIRSEHLVDSLLVFEQPGDGDAPG